MSDYFPSIYIHMTQSKVDAPQVLVNLMTRDDDGGPDADAGYPLTRHTLDKGRVPVNRLFMSNC